MSLYAGIAYVINTLSLIDTVTILKRLSQSAGNQTLTLLKKKEVGTSETTRVNIEHVKNISVHVNTHLKPLNVFLFGHYLAGLIDGGGHFSSQQQLIICFS